MKNIYFKTAVWYNKIKKGVVMRILQTFWYALGSKPAFDQLPAVIDDFLHIHGLTHRFFHYYLENLDLTEMFRSTLDGTKCLRCGAPSIPVPDVVTKPSATCARVPVVNERQRIILS